MLKPGKSRLAVASNQVLNFLFTPRCAGCNREGGYLCAVCLSEAKPLPQPYFPDNAGGPSACLVSSIHLSGVLACFAMEGSVRQAVHDLKYNGVRAIAPEMIALMAERVRSSGLSVDAVTAVPLHPKRSRQRGYNQAELLGKGVAKATGLPFIAALKRAGDGPPQALTRSMQERSASVQGAFATSREIKGLRLLVVDDVCTTGATLDACAQPMMFAGATSVWGLAFAREL